MTFEQSIFAMIDALFQGTAGGTIQWTETAEENSFRAVLANGLVRIEKYTDPRAFAGGGAVPITTGLPFKLPPQYKAVEHEIYTLVVLDDRNREIARFVPEQEGHAMTMRNLWELACRGARNADQRLQAILQELNSKAGRK
jgi:hypothetical protein